MLATWQFRLLIALGVLTIALALTNAVLFTQNRTVQQEVNARQQYVQQSASLEGLYRDIVKALAELAVKSNDAPLLQMLASQGISLTMNAPPAAPAQAAAPTGSTPGAKR
jgi:hypothetical protein